MRYKLAFLWRMRSCLEFRHTGCTPKIEHECRRNKFLAFGKPQRRKTPIVLSRMSLWVAFFFLLNGK